MLTRLTRFGLSLILCGGFLLCGLIAHEGISPDVPNRGLALMSLLLEILGTLCLTIDR